MNPLDAELNVLINAAKEADQPSGVARKRMKGALMATLAAGGATVAGTASASIAAKGMVAASATGTVLKLGSVAKVTLLSAALFTAGTVAVVQQNERSTQEPQTPRSLVMPVQVDSPVQEEVLEETEAPVEEVKPVVVKKKTKAATHKPTRLADELQMLKEIRSARRSGEFEAADEALREYRREFARGALRVEAAAEAAMLLCESGKEQQGQRAANRFLRRHPKSPFAVRVRATCLE